MKRPFQPVPEVLYLKNIVSTEDLADEAGRGTQRKKELNGTPSTIENPIKGSFRVLVQCFLCF